MSEVKGQGHIVCQYPTNTLPFRFSSIGKTITEICPKECLTLKNTSKFLYPLHNEVVGGGYTGFTPSVRPSICLSVRPASRVNSVAPTILIGSISFSYILSSNFRRCVTCKVHCKIFKFEFLAFFFLICNFYFVLSWLGIWCESLIWVIMGYLRMQAF